MDYNEGMICFSHFAEFGELQKKKKQSVLKKILNIKSKLRHMTMNRTIATLKTRVKFPSFRPADDYCA